MRSDLRCALGRLRRDRLKLAIGAAREAFDDGTWQDALALPGLGDVIAELAQLVGERRASPVI